MVKRKLVKRIYERGREKAVPAIKTAMPKTPKTIFSSPKIKSLKPKSFSPREKPKTAFAAAKSLAAATVTTAGLISEHYELPARYGKTALTLMVKDPFWIFAYWEIARGSLQDLKNRVSAQAVEQARFVLRMYDVTLIDFNGHNANNFFDLEVGPHADNWYISLWRDCVSYVGEIGLRHDDGRFFALARSNVVHTPRASYSGRSEQIWMEVKKDQPALAFVRPIIKPPPAKERHLLKQILAEKKKVRAIYLNEEDVRTYYTKLTPLLRDIIASRLKKVSDRYLFILEGESEQERQAILARLPEAYFLKRILLGASESMILGGSEQRLKGPGQASEFIQEKLKAHQFFFELATELIVYGRSERDAEVFLGDKKIPLRSDGTFTLRLALPDGKLPLQFKAVSADKKESRKITTAVQRSTQYEQRKEP